MAETRKLLRLLPALLVTGAIFAAASLPGKYQPSFLHGGVDKYAHALAYGILAASYLFAFGRNLPRRFPLRTSTATIFICLAYGGLEEWYQSFIPGRRPDKVDLEADMIGVMVVILFWVIILLKRSAKLQHNSDTDSITKGL
ncbi:MAG: VanZ family protein [Thermodesulfobacteriota bacterium]